MPNDNGYRRITAAEVAQAQERRTLTWEALTREWRRYMQPWQEEMFNALRIDWADRIINPPTVEHTQTQQEDQMAMSRADFEVVAMAMAEHRPDPKHGTVGEKRVWALTVRSLAAKLEAAYPSFNKDLFYKACGYTGEGL